MVPDINTNQNSPPVEGCPQDGVVNAESRESSIVDAAKKGTFKINGSLIKLNPVLQLPYNPELKVRASALRKAGNLPEVLFWMQVNQKKFHGIDFDRQRVIGNYIVDYYVKKLGLVIEIDGSSHDNKEEYDALREAFLVSLGLRVYRIRVNDIMKRMANVMSGLEEFIITEYG